MKQFSQPYNKDFNTTTLVFRLLPVVFLQPEVAPQATSHCTDSSLSTVAAAYHGQVRTRRQGICPHSSVILTGYPKQNKTKVSNQGNN